MTKKSGQGSHPPSRRQIQERIKAAPDKKSRLGILQGLAEMKHNWVPDLLLDCLNDPCEDNREFIIRTLSARDDLDLEKVDEILHSLPWYVKSAGLRLLGLKKEPNTVKYITTTIKDSNADVRIQAAWALGEIGGEACLALLSKLAKDPNKFVRDSAQKALSKASRLRFS